MGVQSLWELLSPSATYVSLNSLRGKVLAVDASLFLLQIAKAVPNVQDTTSFGSSSDPNENAQLRVLFHRMCKLIHYGIKPVFVFDGATPSVKLRTLERRRKDRSSMERKLVSLANRLIMGQMLTDAASTEPSSSTEKNKPSLVGKMLQNSKKPKQSPRLDDDDSSCDGESVEREAASKLENSDKEENGTKELAEYFATAEDNSLDMSGMSYDSLDREEISKLPLELQYEILSSLRWKQIAVVREDETLSELFKQSADEFSTGQLNRFLKVNKITKEVEGLRQRMNQASAPVFEAKDGVVQPLSIEGKKAVKFGRFASDSNREWVMVPRNRKRAAASDADEGDGSSAIEAAAEPIAEHSLRANVGQAPANPGLPSSVVDELFQDFKRTQDIKALVSKQKQTIASSLSSSAAMETAVTRSSLFSSSSVRLPLSLSAESRLTDTSAAHTAALPNSSSSQKGFALPSSDADRQEDTSLFGGFVVESNTGTALVDERIVVSGSPTAEHTNRTRSLRATTSNGEIDARDEDSSSDGVPDTFLDDVHIEIEVPGDIYGVVCSDVVSSSEASSDASESVDLRAAVDDEEFADEFAEGPVVHSSTLPENVSDTQDDTDSQDFDAGEEDVSVQEALLSEGRNSLSRGSLRADDADSQAVTKVDAELTVDFLERTEEEPLVAMVIRESEESDDGIEEPTAHELEEPIFPVPQSEKSLHELISQLRAERENLRRQISALRLASDHSAELFLDCRELLQLFGIPYVMAPYEADSQCAFLSQNSLVHGVISEDSDMTVFGATRVFRHVLDNAASHVHCYDGTRIQQVMGLDQDSFIALAFLLGSDYTDGVKNVGIVTAMEIVAALGLAGLSLFAKWLRDFAWNYALECEDDPAIVGFFDRFASYRRHFELPNDSWPDPTVIDAYKKPAVDTSLEAFKWGNIRYDLLDAYCRDRFRWGPDTIQRHLNPLRRASAPLQLSMDAFTEVRPVANIASQRLYNAIFSLTNGKTSIPKPAERERRKRSRRTEADEKKFEGLSRLASDDDLSDGVDD
eukprot:ANDGO_00937.mRNA.1 DNA repair protein UVH3